jgi:starch synthase (maltosyl-transferring)
MSKTPNPEWRCGMEVIRRAVIENVTPEVDGGRFAIKRVLGERVRVRADVFTDGNDALAATLLYRSEGCAQWSEVDMRPLGSDQWEGEFLVTSVGIYRYTVQARIDPFQTWCRGLVKKHEARQDLSVEWLVGIKLMEEAADRAEPEAAKDLRQWATNLRQLREGDAALAMERVMERRLQEAMHRHADQKRAVTYERQLSVTVDREKARFGAWYEMFPRSCSTQAGQHGTLADCMKRMEYVAGMGFDIVYLPPIHPIGHANRKGKNNTLTCAAKDVGSPWAIGGAEGGHKAIHPELGTLLDFQKLMAKAQELGLEVAMDIAYQCAPDHPYAREHKEWFRLRPDGTIQYAENPPKKYEDILPLNFENEHSLELCEELKSVVIQWIEQGVRIFRIDNPHTKPFAFWQWLIAEVKRQWPEVIFLAEAFTRPKVMYRLAKLGFTQSYSYFAWRNTKSELAQYFTELTQGEVREFLRPNLWPNTPDILTEYLQFGGRAAFMTRFALAATLGASYGIYGPPFEHCENQSLHPDSEEYLDSEKYQLRHWDIARPDSLRDFIARMNAIRKENPALHGDWGLRFHEVDNEALIAFSKATEDLSNIILTVVNLDPHHTQTGWVELPLKDFQLSPDQPFQVHDLIRDTRYLWNGARNYVELSPQTVPAHIFRIRRKVRTERDFDYYL